MLPLSTLFELSKGIQTGRGVAVVDSTESPTFDGAWGVYISQAAKNPDFYTTIWQSAAAFALTEGNKAIDLKVVRDASRYVAMSYIAAAHYGTKIVHETPPDDIQETLHKEISSKVVFISHISHKMTMSLTAQLNAGGGKASIDDGLRAALGEFYSLCIYALRELRPSSYHSMRDDINAAVGNYTTTMRSFDLPLFMNRDERARQAEVGEDVAVLAARPGISTGDAGEKGKLLTFGPIAKRTSRAP